MRSVALLIVGVSVLTSLGWWQIERGREKERRFATFVSRTQLPMDDLSTMLRSGATPEELRWRRCRVEGRFVTDASLLLDNQVEGGQAVYHVLTPLVSDAVSQPIMVDRGWVPQPADRSRSPEVETPSASVLLTGFLGPEPASGVRVGTETAEPLTRGLTRIARLNLSLPLPGGRPYFPLVFYLDANSAAGFTRDWRQPGSGAERHFAYAVQWFALAAVLAALWIRASLRPSGPAHDRR